MRLRCASRCRSRRPDERCRIATDGPLAAPRSTGDRTGHDDTDSKICTPDTRTKSWSTTPDWSSSTRTSGRALRILKYVLKFGCPSHPGSSSMPEEKPSPEPEAPPVPAKPESAARGGKTKDGETGVDIHLTGADVEIRRRDDINRMKMIRSYKGGRHETGQKVRGQRTRSNGRTGLTVGVTKKAALAAAQAKKAEEAAPKKEEKKEEKKEPAKV